MKLRLGSVIICGVFALAALSACQPGTPTPTPTGTPVPTPTPAPVTVPSVRFGITWSSSWYQKHYTNDPPQQYTANIGATWDRWDFQWNRIMTPRLEPDFPPPPVWEDTISVGTLPEPREQQYYSYDVAIDEDQDTNPPLHIVGILNGGLPSAEILGNDPFEPGGSWEQYVHAVVSKYGDRIDVWEIGNEDGLPHVLETTDYISAVRIACAIIEQQDSGAEVVLGAPVDVVDWVAWEDITIQDGDVFTMTVDPGLRMVGRIEVDIDAMTHYVTGGIGNPIGIAEVEVIGQSDEPPVDVAVPTHTLTLNDEGWPAPNPLTVTVTVNNATTSTIPTATAIFTATSPGGCARFLVLTDEELARANGEKVFSSPGVYTQALEFGPLTLTESVSITFPVWIQPSEATTLTLEAALVAYPPTDLPTDDWEEVSIPTAEIHPVVFVHGILGSMPPRDSVITQWPQNLLGAPTGEGYLDPFIDSYSPLVENLMKMGYELDATLFPATYDWRQSNRESASHLKWVLESYVPDHVSNTPYAVHDGAADVVVHSMGGMVLRSYVEGLATDGPYGYTVNKAIFIATPHRGFPVTYRTWEGVTWEEYLAAEVPLYAGGVDISGITDIPNDTTLRFAMDELLWPYLVLKQYDPNPVQLCHVSPVYWLPDSELWNNFIAKFSRLLGAEFAEELYEALERHFGQDWPGPVTENWRLLWAGVGCPRTVLYDYTHDGDPQRAIGSLPEMLPPVSNSFGFPARVIPDYLSGDGTTYPYGVQSNPLLEDYGLNEPSRVSAFAAAIGLDNIYVIYGTGRETAYAYEVDPPPTVDPWLLHLPTWWRNTRWINGEPQRDFLINDDGDNLIPTYSTRLRDEGEGLLPALPEENEVAVIGPDPDVHAGHKGLPYSEKGQRAVGWALTGLYDDHESFPFFTPHQDPFFFLNNGDVFMAFLVWSPVDVLVTDPDGRRVGYDPAAGEVVNEIPNAFYSGNGAEEEFFLLPAGREGDYTVTTIGTGSGPYAVSMHRVGVGRVWTMGTVGGEAQPGQVVTHTISYSLPLQSTFFDDVEGGAGNWDADGGWTTVTDTAHSPVTSWRGEASGGQATLTLAPAFDLSGAGYAQLRFWSRFAPGEEALALVEAYNDGGATWEPAWQSSRAQEGWTPVEVDLTGYVGADEPPVRLRFRLTAGAETARWWVDDVALGQMPAQPEAYPLPFVDELDGLDNWTAGGTWTAVSDTVHAGEQSWTTAGDGATLALERPLEAGDAVRPVFAFWTRWTLSQPDAGYVEVSTDGGGSWTAVYTQTASTPEWTRVEVVLEEYAGQRFLVRLRLSAPTTGEAGQAWWVDDVLALDWTPPVVHDLPFEDGFETDENWRSLRGWTATDQAHSGQWAQFAAADEATLQLVDELDLTGAVSPTLTFWEQFTVPAGSRGQVLVSADGGLHWQAVYTRAGNVSAWEQATVDLSPFAGERLQLAFYLESTEGGQSAGLVNPSSVAVAPPVVDESSTERTEHIAGRLLAFSLVSLALPAGLSVMKQTSRRRRSGWLVALATPAILVCVAVLVGAWRFCVYPATPAGRQAAIEARWDRAEAVDEVIGGQVGVVVPARDGIGGGILSPDGRWLAYGLASDSGTWYLVDLSTGQRLDIHLSSISGARWVDNDLLLLSGARGFELLRVPDLGITQLERQPEERLLELLGDTHRVYATSDFITAGTTFVSTDPDRLYAFRTSYNSDEVRSGIPGLTYTIVPRPWANYQGPVTSPDGSLIAVEAEHPEHERWYLEVQTPDGQVVASVYKRAWLPSIMGWGPDNRTLYFYETTTGASATVYWPERPVLKLVVDYPSVTPTPAESSERRGTGVAWPLVASTLPVILVAVVQTSRKRRSGWLVALATPPILVCVAALVGAWRFCVYPATPAGRQAAIEARWDRAEAVDEVIGGQVGVVVPARDGIGGGILSPDGRWLAYGLASDSGTWYLVDLSTGQRLDIHLSSISGARWVDNDLLLLSGARGFELLRVSDLGTTQLERQPEERLLELLEDTHRIYATSDFITAGTTFVSTDPDRLYAFRTSYNSGEVRSGIPGLTYTIVPRRWANPNGPVTSTNGSLIAVWAEHPEHPEWYLEVQTPDGQVVASVYKRAWEPNIMGWGPDNRTLYFYETTPGAAAGVFWPEQPVLKLMVDYPSVTPTPAESSERRGTGVAWPLVASTLPVILVAVVQTSRKRRSGWLVALATPPILVCVAALVGAWRLCVYPTTPAGRQAAIEARWARAEAVDEMIGGQVEVVVPARTGTVGGLVSPDGRWLAWAVQRSTDDVTYEIEKGWYLLNLETGEQFEVPRHEGNARWINFEYLAVHSGHRYDLLHVPDLSIRTLEVLPVEAMTETFRTARQVYAVEGFSFTGSGTGLLSTDSKTPYVVGGGVTEAVADGTLPISYTVVPRRWANSNGPWPSPDGSLIAVRAEHPERPEYYLEIQTPDGQVVASVYKRAWDPGILGWGPDSRALYFYEETYGASASVYWPEQPVLKLVVDYPSATPTPAGEGRLPGAVAALPLLAVALAGVAGIADRQRYWRLGKRLLVVGTVLAVGWLGCNLCGQWAQFAADDRATLQLVDELNLTGAASPTLAFWERFTVPAGSRGQVLVSADGGLHWQAVYTRAGNVSAWEQTTVDLSQFAGERLQLAFYLESTGGGQSAGLVNPSSVAVAPPVVDESSTERTRRVAGRLAAFSLVSLALPAGLLTVRQTSRRRRAGYLAMFGVPTVLVCGIGLACLWRGCVYPLTPAGKQAAIEARWARAEAVDEVTDGQVEVVVSAKENIAAGALVSPDGKWLAYGLHGDYQTWKLVDLETGQRYDIPVRVGEARWVNAEHLFLGGELLHVPDRAIRELELRPAEMLTETFQTAQEVYALVDGSVLFLSTDPATPHRVSYPAYYQTKETLPFSYTVVPLPWANYHGPVTSTNGSLIAVWAEHPEHERWYLEVQTPDGQVVASVYKRAWVPNIMGWGPDNRTLYFYETTTGASATVFWPERPVLKLVVDYPLATPTPSGESRVPGSAQLLPAFPRPAPLAQAGTDPGWYVDDVVVQEAAGPGHIFADDFDRADSSDLGPGWVEEAGDWEIADEQLHAQANGEQGVGTTDSFSDTQYTLETRFRATGNLNQWYNAIALGFGGTEEGVDSTGYSVTYVPAWGKLKLTREYTFLDYASVTLVPGQWYQLKVVRDGDTGLIQVYLDEGQGYPETPTLEAVDSAYPDLRRLGWAMLGSGYDLYVDWIVVQ